MLLGPEVSCGPPELSVSMPFALTIPHCAHADPQHWNIHLKRRTPQGKWEVSSAPSLARDGNGINPQVRDSVRDRRRETAERKNYNNKKKDFALCEEAAELFSAVLPKCAKLSGYKPHPWIP